MRFTITFFLCCATISTLAAPTPKAPLVQNVTPLSTGELSAFRPFTQFARAAYCEPSLIENWSCGEACDALPGFIPTLTGGDGDAIQFFFVGFWPEESTVVVSHQGTDPTQLFSVLTDLELSKGPLNSTLFPGLSSGVEAHEGFRDQHAITAPLILAEVARLLAEKNANSVTLIGHSLGGALAELDSLFLRLNLSSSISVNAFTYGTPRVGNAEFVSFFDSKISNFKRINNQDDVVPVIPGIFLGFAHPQGETHIISDGTAVSCSGDENSTDERCQIKSVPNIFTGNIINHLGPYDGIFIGTLFCT